MLNTKDRLDEVLNPNWEGLYRVTSIICLGTSTLEDLGDKPLEHLWNVEHFRIYYPYKSWVPPSILYRTSVDFFVAGHVAAS